MINTDSTVDHVVRRVLLDDVGEGADAAAIAAGTERIFLGIYDHLGRWIGLDGCDALVRRAFDHVRETCPWLAPVRTRPRHRPHLEGLAAAVEGREPTLVFDTSVRLLAAFVEYLGVAIGLDLALRLFADACRRPARGPAPPESSHDW